MPRRKDDGKSREECADADSLLRCYRAILDNINEGVIATNREGRIIVYNRRLAEFEDMAQEDVLGKKLMDVYRWSVESSEHMRVLRTGQPVQEGNYRNVTRRGKENRLIATTLPLTEDGAVVAAYSISRDVARLREIYNRSVALQPPAEAGGARLSNGTRYGLEHLIFASRAMKEMLEEAQKAARRPSPVLIRGETGVGKEIVAQGLHNAGENRAQPFVAINCAAIPETLMESLLFGTVKGAFTGAENIAGFFEQAKEGTIYLDEIHSMPPKLQAKLLRVIQEKAFRRVGGMSETPLRCRLISSIGMDPAECMRTGQLRRDLYYRIGVITLSIPPLRERREDILPLAEHFCERFEEIYGRGRLRLSDDAIAALNAYDWPGNVRELEHAIERAISMTEEGDSLTLCQLPAYLRERPDSEIREAPFGASPAAESAKGAPQSLRAALLATEKREILRALADSENNISRAAKLLRIGRQNLQYRMKKLGIRAKDERDRS
ncbi:MAG: sigma 54-interacting transcriptional regulator [Clostridiales Family XIII bacterium]|jgi:arginine utilization regulatory protein|nr:sigma 54-interacting transcriptional regulator [Clostridiales Family XIII bacterium]